MMCVQIIPYDDARKIDDVDVFSNFVVLEGA